MTRSDIDYLAATLELRPAQVERTAALFADGATVPFIARYRKEATGSLDEVQLLRLRDALTALEQLHRRRAAMLESLTERELLTPELAAALAGTFSLTVLEDLYLPFKPKRQTRAAVARARGLADLATLLLAQTSASIDFQRWVKPELGVPDAAAAVAGAADIVAETISEDAAIRQELRTLFQNRACFAAKVVKARATLPEAQTYRDYFDYAEAWRRVPSHRVLAILRGAAQGFLSVQLRPERSDALELLQRRVIRNRAFAYRAQLEDALQDAYVRLLQPALENEAMQELKRTADTAAIAIFAANLKKLLLEAPLGAKRLLAFDPGFRTGCKTVVLDAQGNLEAHLVVFPDHPGAADQVRRLAQEHRIEAVAVGNGTAGRETEDFLRGCLPPELPVISVNESGASIYSAGEVARREFPELDLTFRSAVSIGRRLQDPLSELIKLDPAAIGVGQYQHDVDSDALQTALNDVVTSCVNTVGVELNQAGAELLTYVAGVGPKLAEAIVAHRRAHGPFRRRRDLLDVKGLGPKAFSQCAGFLLIRDAADPLDGSAVHPERYELVKRMATDCGCSVVELMRRAAAGDPGIDPQRYIDDAAGAETIRDILAELRRPGRDPRSAFQPFAFAADLRSLADVTVGRKVPGIVTNVTAFGAFVDIGVHQDGLLHISRMARHFIRDPQEVVSVHDTVMVTVVEVDPQRRRIGLSLIED